MFISNATPPIGANFGDVALRTSYIYMCVYYIYIHIPLLKIVGRRETFSFSLNERVNEPKAWTNFPFPPHQFPASFPINPCS